MRSLPPHQTDVRDWPPQVAGGAILDWARQAPRQAPRLRRRGGTSAAPRHKHGAGDGALEGTASIAMALDGGGGRRARPAAMAPSAPPPPPKPAQASPAGPGSGSEGLPAYSVGDVVAHNAEPGRAGGWIVIDGLVYDIGPFLDDHPGGKAGTAIVF